MAQLTGKRCAGPLLCPTLYRHHVTDRLQDIIIFQNRKECHYGKGAIGTLTDLMTGLSDLTEFHREVTYNIDKIYLQVHKDYTAYTFA